jgi:hypothetical protein
MAAKPKPGKPKRGAPPKPPDERKGIIMPIRLTQGEKAEIDAVADGNASKWARNQLLRAARAAKNRKQ